MSEGAAPDSEALELAIERIRSGDRLGEAERAMASVLPELRVLLAEALESGGWFGEPHQSETLRVATLPDPDERLEALRNLLEEETNIGLLVGVAVGWALRAEIADSDAGSAGDGPEERQEETG